MFSIYFSILCILLDIFITIYYVDTSFGRQNRKIPFAVFMGAVIVYEILGMILSYFCAGNHGISRFLMNMAFALISLFVIKLLGFTVKPKIIPSSFNLLIISLGLLNSDEEKL